MAEIPERTYHGRLAKYRAGKRSKGPWPSPKVDAIEAVAAKYAADWPAWGHRKIAAMMRADGHVVSTSTVLRALRRSGLLLPSGFRADRRSWSRLRKRVFHDPPTERNRVWQMDFSEFETARGGIWRTGDRLRHQVLPGRYRHPHLADRTRWRACAARWSRLNGSSPSMTCGLTAARWTSLMLGTS